MYITTGYGREKLSWSEARKHDPIGYESHMITVSGSSGMPLAPDPTDSRQYRRGEEEGIDEKRWAEEEFLSGAKKYVGGGKLGVRPEYASNRIIVIQPDLVPTRPV